MTRASRPLAPRTLAWALLVLALGLCVGSVSGADASGKGRASGRIELVGDAALIDSNVGNFSSKHYFNAVVRVANSIPRTENLTVEFVVKQGSRVVATAQETAGIRRGGGVVMKQLLLERKGRYRVSARFVHFEEAADPDPLATLEVGNPTFIHNGSPFCSMTAHVTNPSGEKVDAKYYLIGLRGGKIVAAALTLGPFFGLEGGRSADLKVDLITCVKTDQVRVYAEGSGD